MKQIASSILRSGTLCYAWKVVRRDERVFGFTDHDEDLTFDGLTYKAASGFTASAVESELGLNVDNLEVEGVLSSDAIKEEDIKKGLFAGADIFLYRVNWQAPSSDILLQRGSIGEITRSPHGFRAELRGLAHYLSYPHGRVYQRNCDADLGDHRCRVQLSDYTAEAQVETIDETELLITSRGLADFATSFFTKGKITFLDGDNQGLSFQVRRHEKEDDANYLFLWQKPPFAIKTNDRFSIAAGCDKRFETCRLRFRNQVNFRGFPHFPGNDFVQVTPKVR